MLPIPFVGQYSFMLAAFKSCQQLRLKQRCETDKVKDGLLGEVTLGLLLLHPVDPKTIQGSRVLSLRDLHCKLIVQAQSKGDGTAMSFTTDHIETISLLQAMYPLPEEITLSRSTQQFLDEQGDASPEYLELTLRLSLEDHPGKIVDLFITLSTVNGRASITPRQPEWSTRTTHQVLSDSIQPQTEDISASEYILDTVESVKQTASALHTESLAQESANNLKEVDEPEDDGSLERVWFWFPMLSTREKRKDMVDYAPRYNLTGFVLAGKPALLCLEGNGRAVERYMSDIKSNSWGDIPSFQKKVTERFRRRITVDERKFDKMSDITNTVNHYGQYNHRGDMGQVRLLMEEWGVGEDFGAAVMNNMT